MDKLEKRLQAIENRQALQDVLIDYLIAVDERESVDAVMECFTNDPEFDMSGIGYPNIRGESALRSFFESTFANMSAHAHYATNFKVDSMTEDTAACRTHVIGMGCTNEGQQVLFYLQYQLRFVRSGSGWKIQHFRGKALMPF